MKNLTFQIFAYFRNGDGSGRFLLRLWSAGWSVAAQERLWELPRVGGLWPPAPEKKGLLGIIDFPRVPGERNKTLLRSHVFVLTRTLLPQTNSPMKGSLRILTIRRNY